MSDTAAFLAGCAVTGVAALFLVKNNFAAGQPGGFQPEPSPTQSSTSTLSVPSSVPGFAMPDNGRDWRFETKLEQQQNAATDLSNQIMRQQNETEALKGKAEDLKGWLQKQQGQTEDLKNQLEKQQQYTNQLISQLQEQQRLIDRMSSEHSIEQSIRPLAPLPSSSAPEEDSVNLKTIVLWALGGVLLVIVIGGGVVLIAIILVVVFSRRRPSSSRTVHVVHPMPPQPYIFQGQQHALPPSRVRMQPPRQYDYYDE
jgi:hypothetical protein